MSRWRRIGLSLTFAMTLAGSVLVSQPAQAFTLNPTQCARLEHAVNYLEELASRYPDSKLTAFLVGQAKQAYATYCS
jgi:hypothetical protein